jgi:hypothetical protein
LNTGYSLAVQFLADSLYFQIRKLNVCFIIGWGSACCCKVAVSGKLYFMARTSHKNPHHVDYPDFELHLFKLSCMYLMGRGTADIECCHYLRCNAQNILPILQRFRITRIENTKPCTPLLARIRIITFRNPLYPPSSEHRIITNTKPCTPFHVFAFPWINEKTVSFSENRRKP